MDDQNINSYTKRNCNSIQPSRPLNQRGGFSFMEIMIVVILMAGIASIAVPNFFGKLGEANINTANIQMKSLSSALDFYRLDNSTYPSTEQGLEALISKPEVGKIPKNWKGPYLSSKLPKDPWSNTYGYQSEGRSFKIISLGADGEEGGEGINADIIFEK